MFVRRRRNSFRPSIDILPSRIAPTVFTPIDPVDMGSGDDLTGVTDPAPTVQVMPTDVDSMVGPSY